MKNLLQDITKMEFYYKQKAQQKYTSLNEIQIKKEKDNKEELSQKSFRRIVSDFYRHDPYLYNHIQRTNSRQRKRMRNMNNLLKQLDDIIPEKLATSRDSVKPHSKLGILNRTTEYIKILQEAIKETKIIEK